ncbi:MAG: hypothetical protein U0487_01355 [Patescibacteria group bacterium]
MFDTEIRSLDRHFGYLDTEGPVALVTRAMQTALRHGQLAMTDIALFLAALSVVRNQTEQTLIDKNQREPRPWFDLAWTTLKPQPLRTHNWITDEVRIFALKRLRSNPDHRHLFEGRDMLLRRLSTYQPGSIDQLALQCAVRLHEDLLLRIAFEHLAIREEVASIVNLDKDDFRERMLAIKARSEAHKAYLNWEPLRKLMTQPSSTPLEASP